MSSGSSGVDPLHTCTVPVPARLMSRSIGRSEETAILCSGFLMHHFDASLSVTVKMSSSSKRIGNWIMVKLQTSNAKVVKVVFLKGITAK